MENLNTKLGQLYLVATPIGNLDDISLRALKILKNTQIIYAEDTRVSKILLTHFDIKSNIYTLNQHSGSKVFDDVLLYLLNGKDVVYVSDAGTPGVSDPGAKLVNFLVSVAPQILIVPIPGASALTSIVSIAGLHDNCFYFLGFFPKKKHTKLFDQIQTLNVPFIFFDSPHRIVKNLNEIKNHFGDNTNVIVGRELTKMHETIYRGSIAGVSSELSRTPVKGEIVCVVLLKNS